MDESEKNALKKALLKFILTFKPNKNYPRTSLNHFFDPDFASSTKHTPKKKATKQNGAKVQTIVKLRQFDEHLQSSAAVDQSLRIVSRGAKRVFPKIGVGPPNPWNFHRGFEPLFSPSILEVLHPPIFGSTQRRIPRDGLGFF